MIVLENLFHRYDSTVALNRVNLEVLEKDNIFCLMGPNGAGKTTLVRILSTQLKPTSGKAYVLGFDVIKEANEIRKRIAILPQEARPLNEATPWEMVYWYLVSRGESFSEAKRRTESVLKELNLWEYKDKPCLSLSGGLKRRVLLALTVATSAELIFLDEPTLGLDPLSKRETWRLISELREETFFFVTTNVGLEAESLAKTVAIINRGRIIAKGNPEELKGETYKHKLIFTDDVQIKGAIKFGDKKILYFNEFDEIHEILRKLNSYSIQPTDLEDVFIAFLEGERNES
ncbi:ABC transporter ATP-binding protein [Thermococcus kodakarensis]|uniref:ABC transporter ATP-binding protein n=1 Tax=Thermococcus kodakarensis TaxID=311400 RepID=UPI00064FE657|nr:ABC transporter ATP-binding protein [Thermococcus kodakarensis]WCN28319.1 ABC transporter ATP-binding protein [Thermococcus kodakarensis]WCN30615.1 ABC transporter ATP-binding protein [Thermococcus kodakarensis]